MMAQFKKTALVGAMMMATSYASAEVKKPFMASLDLGYAFGQELEYEQTVRGSTSAGIMASHGSGFAYGLNFGYYLADAHRLKLGYTAFKTTMSGKTLAGQEYDIEFDNSYIHVDYDYIGNINNTMDWTIGINLGSFSAKQKLGSDDDAVKISSMGYGLQLGLQWNMDQLVIATEIRSILNGGIDSDESLGVTTDYKLPYVILFNVGVGYRF